MLYGVKGIASVGFHYRDLRNEDRNDISTVVANVGLEKTFNKDKTTADAGFVRRPVESTFSSTTTYDEKLWNLGVKHLLTHKLRGRAAIYYGNRDWEESVLTGTRVLVGTRLFAIGSSVVKRTDQLFGYNLGFDYRVRKWLILHADYNFSRSNSNISALDSTEHAMSLRATLPL